MKTKMNFLAIFLVIAAMAITTSCEDDETTPRPVITLTELGYENSKTGYAGTELHIEAEIVAEGTIDVITIEIHPEGEHGDEHEGEHEHGEEWEVDTTYSEFSGLKNTTFHKHIDIPTTAETGHYHFHFIVTDMEGYQTVMEEEIEIQVPDDNEAPTITIANAPQENEEFADGETIRITGTITDNIALGGIYVGLVRENQNLENAEVNATNTITLLHTHDFPNPMSYDFDASIVVGAASDNNPDPSDLTGDLDGGAAWQSGNYYLVVKSPDAFGSGVSFSQHYPIVINY